MLSCFRELAGRYPEAVLASAESSVCVPLVKDAEA
jgi:hypothetical protein